MTHPFHSYIFTQGKWKLGSTKRLLSKYLQKHFIHNSPNCEYLNIHKQVNEKTIEMNLKIIRVSERNKTKKYIPYDSIYQNSKHCKLIYSDRKQISSCLRMGVFYEDSENGVKRMCVRYCYLILSYLYFSEYIF